MKFYDFYASATCLLISLEETDDALFENLYYLCELLQEYACEFEELAEIAGVGDFYDYLHSDSRASASLARSVIDDIDVSDRIFSYRFDCTEKSFCL